MKNIKKYIFIIAIVLSIFILDQIIKMIVINQENEITIFQGVLKLSYSENTESIMGIAKGNILSVITTDILILAILIRFLMRQINNMNLMPKISLSFIIAGGLSNFVDKIIRGKVIDYIDISELINKFPTFNIADIFIIIGFVIFAITVFIDLLKMHSKN